MHIRPLMVACLVMLAAAPGVGAQALKIGYINSAAILQQAPGAQEANQQFNRDVEGYRAEVQKMGEELEAMAAQYEQQQLTLSPEAKTRREEDLRQRQAAYQQRVQQLDQQAQARQQELVQPVMDRITAVIEALRAEQGYALILDVAAGSIISADPSLDLTDVVIQRLKAQGPAETSGAQP